MKFQSAWYSEKGKVTNGETKHIKVKISMKEGRISVGENGMVANGGMKDNMVFEHNLSIDTSFIFCTMKHTLSYNI